MEGKANQIKQEYKSRAEAIFVNLQQEVEESFNRIDAQLDELLNDKCNLINILRFQVSSDLPKLNCNIVLQFKNDDFSQQIISQMSPLIKTNSQNQNKSNEQLNVKPFAYQLIQQNSIKQNEYCCAIAVNKDFSILVAGCYSQIKVFEFKQGNLKQVQLLSEHTYYVYTLNFMKKSDQFISGSSDSLIIIWGRNENNQWNCQSKLNGHTNTIYCLIINDNEDLIISGSNDTTIKFWQKQNQWLCSQTITHHNSRVFALSLNESQNKLISCGEDKLILVMEQSEQNQQWTVIQKITVEIKGLRLCFIDNNIFTFQPFEKEYMDIYEMSSTNKQFIKTKDIPVKDGLDQCFFPQYFIKSKGILVNKNGLNVNLIKIKSNTEFIIQQSIDFGTRATYGYMTDDGQYLITWDDNSKEYQIRIYQEL
ncbi:unnamed protein product [Paramecium octaurelia]|uniref:WD domain, G-beta repeat protein n=1 Tax=Paramecium octaurelia TaxID=43137 RepID=A0A8S1SCF0_PAROT|nr:unnamed protein product [Paramecium octaurelia]